MTAETFKIGELRERVTLQTRTTSIAADRQRKNTWTNTGEFWAKVSANAGGEPVVADALKGERTWTVTARYYDAVNSADSRWLWRGRVLEIQSVLPDEKKRFMVMRCVERGP